MDNKSIVVITSGWFPEGDAGAIRLKMIGKALVEVGYSVTVLCRGCLNDEGQVDGISYVSFRNRSGGSVVKTIDYLNFPNKVKNYLRKHLIGLYGLYIYNVHDSLFSYYKAFSKTNSVKLFYDCVEWYSPEEYKLGRLDPWYRMKDRTNRKIIDKSFSVITITRYLNDYYSEKGIRTLRVPALCDSIGHITEKSHFNNKLTVFYGGLPGKKDLVGNLLEAALLLNKNEQNRLRFILVGATREYLINVSGVKAGTVDGCSAFLELCGYVSRATVLDKMKTADFAFLARDASLRYAQAGFPSKVVEALSNATPILCNLSSDLGDYLVDGENAIIAVNHKPEAIRDALRRAIQLSALEKNEMSKQALITAREKFDYRLYKNEISDFFK